MVVCPLSGSADVELLKSFDAKKLVADWLRTFQIDISEEFNGYQRIDLYKSNVTQLRFFYPPAVEGSARLYEHMQRFDWFYKAEKWEHRVALDILNKKDRVLEIGSGKGAFLSQCLSRGIDTTGLELNAAAIAEAQAELLPVLNVDIETYVRNKESSFDAVCAFQVLEHVANPMALLKNMLFALKRGGQLILSVPNAESFLRHDYNLLDMPPHHMTQWSKKSLTSLTKIFQLKPLEILTEPLPAYHVDYFLSVYYRRLLGDSPPGYQRGNLYRFAEFILSSGFRKWIKGQTILAHYVKI